MTEHQVGTAEAIRAVRADVAVLHRHLVRYDLVVWTSGGVLEGDFAPSSDTAAHAYVYRHMPEVGGVVWVL